MSCSSFLQLDIEDIILKKGINKNKVRANIPIYKEIIFEIYKWSQEIQKKKLNCNIRKLFNKYFGKILRQRKIYLNKGILIWIYRKMIQNKEIENYSVIWILLRKKPIRNMSGVTIITVLTSPFPDGQSFSCKHNCYYCPNEPGMPRSYLKKEPAVSRGFRNKWDAESQMRDRLKALSINGHEIDKLEIIIEGGTYTEYPEEYLKRFHRDLVYTANVFFDKKPRKRFSVEKEIHFNAFAKIRIIGICIETRPDTLFDDSGKSWLPRFRRWGVTRVQLGVQHTNNSILKKINRGHTIEDAEKAIAYLKSNCFKVDIHLMPDLPGSTPDKDKTMFEYIFSSSKLQPDQVKIYPCEVVPWTILKKWHDSGKFIPYSKKNEKDLFDVIKYAMEICPPWIRLPRVIRDIPTTYIEGGNKIPNLRQILYKEMKKEGKTSQDIRVRECGRHPTYKIQDAIYRTRAYLAHGRKELFISCESRDEKCLFGFIRLHIPNREETSKSEFSVLTNEIGLIRELHVYGNVLPVGYNKKTCNQHKGIGRKLLRLAEFKAKKNNCVGVAVISGMGVTKYYKKFGYHESETFMMKYFPITCPFVIHATIYLLVLVLIFLLDLFIF